jgi:8-oxo-dGTP diphosphatase
MSLWLWGKIQKLSRSINLKVVIGFIQNPKAELLITRRSIESHYGGYWELPGGKIEDGESPLDAIKRELREELDFQIDAAYGFAQLPGDIEFYLFHIKHPEMQPILKAGQLAYAWIDVNQLSDYLFPPSNRLFFDSWLAYQAC